MSSGVKWFREKAALDLAALLKASRAYIAETRPHICAKCGHLFQLPSLNNGRHCAGCGVERAPTQGWRSTKETHHA